MQEPFKRCNLSPVHASTVPTTVQCRETCARTHTSAHSTCRNRPSLHTWAHANTNTHKHISRMDALHRRLTHQTTSTQVGQNNTQVHRNINTHKHITYMLTLTSHHKYTSRPKQHTQNHKYTHRPKQHKYSNTCQIEYSSVCV